ncbi:uncharacterized CRM domain-containing protein At3g25440, chloroplastic [Mercurialis annua]|uniref:uncharacterized CRM domain-containing protein At3g25440, chloroplastic n=1 Tax=Mercurialis annua TaxID=3986 RepID=UPI00215F32E2|nr:uncharacterized CRM domain-containing protein At3g25440, chloroplastic [Mercurialis annua]
MAKALFCSLRRASSLVKFNSFSIRPIFEYPETVLSPLRHVFPQCWVYRNLSHGRVNLVILDGKPKFETHEADAPKKEKWLTKKRLKLQRKREKEKRRAANRKDPRRLTVKRKKQKFANVEERIKYKLERARIKEGLLIERLKRYEVPKAQGPEVKPHDLTGEERFFMKKMAQKKLNYVPLGRRGVFGGVILNMHMHWKKHETVKVICNSCKPGQVHEYAEEIARLSGGLPIQIVGDDTIIFYRGKNYVQPKVMSPIDTLSRKRAWEKSKYEQSLESVRHFIAIAEKELELYYRHIALYGDPTDRNPLSILDNPTEDFKESEVLQKKSNYEASFRVLPPGVDDSTDNELSEIEDENLSESESDSTDRLSDDSDDEETEREGIMSLMTDVRSSTMLGKSAKFENHFDIENHNCAKINKVLI